MASKYSPVQSCHLGFSSGLCLLHTKIRLGQCLCIKLFAPSTTWPGTYSLLHKIPHCLLCCFRNKKASRSALHNWRHCPKPQHEPIFFYCCENVDTGYLSCNRNVWMPDISNMDWRHNYSHWWLVSRLSNEMSGLEPSGRLNTNYNVIKIV